MTRRAALTEAARNDIREARRWYREVHPVLARDFARSVRTSIDRIVAYPESYRVVHRDVRKALVHRFPYLILYRVTEDALLVLAVLHASRDPGTQTSRIT